MATGSRLVALHSDATGAVDRRPRSTAASQVDEITPRQHPDAHGAGMLTSSAHGRTVDVGDGLHGCIGVDYQRR